MRVLVVSAAFPPMKAGEAEHMYHLCAQLARAGVEVHVLTSRDGRASAQHECQIYAEMSDWSWKELPRLAKKIKQCRPDAILLYYIGWIYHQHPMITFAPTVSKRLLPNCRVATMFAYPEGSNGGRRSVATRLARKAMAKWAGEEGVDYEFGTLLRDSDTVIVMSDLHRLMFAGHHALVEKKAVLVPPPPLLNMAKGDAPSIRMKVRTAWDLRPDDFVIAYFGFIYPAKGVETILQAFALVSQTHPRAWLVLVGGELARQDPDRPLYGAEMRKLAGELGCAGKVVWTGAFSTEGDEASRYLLAADAGVFGHDLGVAMNNSSFAALVAHGLPIVATKGATVEPQLRSGENVLLCTPKSPQAMASALRLVLDDTELRKRLCGGAERLAKEWFSWPIATERILQLLSAEKVAAGSSEPAGRVATGYP